MNDDERTSTTTNAGSGEPLRFHPTEDGRHTAPVIDAGAYVRNLRTALEDACGNGTPGLVSQGYIDTPRLDAHFAIVPLFGLTNEQAIPMLKQWHLDVCNALGVDPSARPAQSPTLALTLLDGLAETADRTHTDGAPDPAPDGDGAA